MTENAIIVGYMSREEELVALNAELLQDLIEVLPYAKNWIGENHACIRNAEGTIAKAEALQR